MRPLAPRFAPKKKATKALARESGVACALCPSRDAKPRPLYKGAPLCDTCSRNQVVGSVARVVLNAAGKYLLGGVLK